MSFDLRIEFSGLCLFVKHGDREQVGVVMPDARKHTAIDTMRHSDGMPAEPHCGYLRFDLGNLISDVKPGFNNSESPPTEVVHRFNRESLDLGLRSRGRINVDHLEFPDFGEIDPSLTLISDLFTDTPPNEVLMWTKLTGGYFTAHSAGSNWKITRPQGVYQGQFANYVVWTRHYEGIDELTLTIKDFVNPKSTKPPTSTSITLTQHEELIRLKISNLCAENPLEWPDLKLRAIEGTEDKDFKWLYRLFSPPGVPAGARLRFAPDQELFVPVLDRASGPAGVESDCTGGKTDGDF